jgi:hypothetical protein
MCTINISEYLVGRSYPEAGDVVYQKIVHEMNHGDKIILNLSDVDSLPSMFLNVSIGRYVDNFGIESLKKKISFANISASQIERIKKYIGKLELHPRN